MRGPHRHLGGTLSRASRVLVTRDFSLTSETLAPARTMRQSVLADAPVGSPYPIGPRGGVRKFSGAALAKLTPIERFIREIPADRRRAHEARQRLRGLTRVTVTVPASHAEDLKTFAKLLRNESDEVLAMYRTWLAEFLADHYRDFDAWVAEGEPE